MSDYRLGMGTLDTATITGSASYIVADFAHVSGIASWEVGEDGIVTPYSRRVRTLNGFIKTVGKLQTTWRFSNLNNRMFRYLAYDLAGGDYSPLVTIYTRNRTIDNASVWVAINCTMILPEFNADGLQPHNGLYFAPVEVKFINGVYAG